MGNGEGCVSESSVEMNLFPGAGVVSAVLWPAGRVGLEEAGGAGPMSSYTAPPISLVTDICHRVREVSAPRSAMPSRSHQR